MAPPDKARFTDPHHPFWDGLLLACALACALPLWLTDHLPFTDLPQHVAAIGTLRHWFDPVWRAQEHFELVLGQTQYLLYYLLGALLAVPFGTAERANLVLLSLTAIAFPYSLRALLRALRADPRLSLFACTLFWSQALLIGFFNYVSAMPLVLYGLSLAVEQARAPRQGTAWLLGTVSLALFYLHLSAFLFFAPACVVAFWLLPGPGAPPPGTPPLRAVALRLVALPLRALWALPSIFAGLLFLLRSPVVNPASIGWHQSMAPGYEPIDVALRNLPDALLDIWKGPADEWALLGLLFAAALSAWPGPRAPEEEEPARLRGLAAAWMVIAAALYLFFPVSIGWLWQLNERYALVFALLAPALLRPAPGLRGAAPLLLAAATSLFSSGVALQEVRAFDREVGPFDQVIAQAEPGKRLLGMMTEQNSARVKFSPFLHFASYYRARKGGVASFSFHELPQSPLRYRPGKGPLQKPPGWEWHQIDFSNAREGDYYDYLLVHGLVDPFQVVPMAGGPRWHLKVREGRWALYEKDPGPAPPLRDPPASPR